jgi:hypothetical protein
MPLLKKTLHIVFFGPKPIIESEIPAWEATKKYIVPLQADWFVPAIDPEAPTGNWIGYMILSISPSVRPLQPELDTDMVTNLKVSFRLTFIGPQAEEMAVSTLFWNKRPDVQQVFKTMQAQLRHVDGRVYTHLIRNDELNIKHVWGTDMSAMTFFNTDTHQVL